ncbi:hypothetical protein LV89_01288 [Arcicella aurantiaca]|uniref:Alpha/beta hydrolase n=1 Tax=Arcicella aurantiaca TaxID=591202 RepID=A0A316EAR0_9BACT|nr:alpha/beta hydrolase [Arcicella aurantiaca]PWK27881.1 hypothetical protein LV89_01288 [Arcicella aurantiaca]
MYTFNSQILILPGLGDSGEKHWQTAWEQLFPSFIRVNQVDWETPICEDWIKNIEKKIQKIGAENVILVGHSLACSTIGYWFAKYKTSIKGALLVAPSDTEADSYPSGTTGFSPMPTAPLPFKTITVTSDDDFYVSLERAEFFAEKWNSKLVVLNNLGHINGDSNLGNWDFGLSLLKELD